ncbi:YhdP family protein [Rhodoferax aquaticus]|uniref:TIGR02099 family protein n=1 Tax=Rhodoferax aquaticus TaxID=2527691 RepID=A0A515EK91_9BURK|nr:YhdP family protein [Rhodoferax aquaticus]QDL53070.1 TIGR02099 family protein [Rhodoferax aquaticus]
MNELTPLPSRLLKTSATLAKWALRMLLAAWVLLGIAWGGLHFLIVPRISELRPTVERHASQLLGIPLRIGNITALSNGLIPSFALSDVTLHNAQGIEVLRLPKVYAALSPRSAMTLGFEQLFVEAPELDVRRTSDGKFWVAGLAISQTNPDDNTGVDWVFSQTELVVRHGSVRWTDELRGAPSVALSDVDVVIRNGLRKHTLHAAATPPALWGDRMRVTGLFTQPFLTHRAGDWHAWSGQAFVDLPHTDLAQIKPYLDLGIDIAQGVGALRAWVDVDHGQVNAVTADLALQSVNMKLAPELDALSLASMSGRLGAKRLEGGFEISTQALQFDTEDGLHWPGGNVRLALFGTEPAHPAHGELAADKLDLAAMVEIASRLPLDASMHQVLRQFAPSGLVESVVANWQGSAKQVSNFNAKGRVLGLSLPAQTRDGKTTPGFSGADIDFDVNPTSGKATLSMRKGTIDAQGVFEEPLIALEQLNGAFQWKVDGPRISVSSSNVKFGNADLQGELQFNWQTSDAKVNGAGQAPHRFPGVLDLQGTLSKADGSKVPRYLPVVVEKDLRDYLHEAIVAGSATGVKFKVKGNVDDFPFDTSKTGEFRVSANVQNAVLAFAPPLIMPKNSRPWPQLTNLSGDLLIERGALWVKGAKAGISNAPGLQISKAEAVITDLFTNAKLQVTTEARGPVPEVIAVINSSPLAEITDKVFEHSSATGVADYKLRLNIPLNDTNSTTLQGAIVLNSNDLQVTPETPKLSKVRGTVNFSDTGFSVSNAQARLLGGDAKLEGGLSFVSNPAIGLTSKPSASPPVLRVTGSATAEGLRAAKELGFVARLAEYANGSTAYTATLGLRSGIPELLVNSNLQGLGINLPAPLAKTPESMLPLRLENAVVRPGAIASTAKSPLQDRWQLDVGRLANVLYVRDVSSPVPRVLSGAIGIGLAADETAPLPAEGVVANISAGRLDVDAWNRVLEKLAGTDAPAGNVDAANAQFGMAYLPTSIALRANELVVSGRSLNRVVLGGAREGGLWRANVDALELSGYAEYRQPSGPSAGKVYARLARLSLAQSTAQDVESLLDEQPSSIPALDVVIEDFELRGKRLGHLEIDAINVGAGAARESAKEWRLNRFNIITPEAVLTASGNWANLNAQAANAPLNRNSKSKRRTVLNFKLDINDSGDLLNRFGMSGVLRKGKGKIEGQVAWLGAPLTLDYPSMNGAFNVNVEAGQFLKADPGLAKLLGVLSLQSLPRRLALDFRDVFSEGFVFDFIRGDVTIEQGIAKTNNLQMKGVSAAALMEGQADIAKETQAIKVVVIPEINAGSASLIASAINPLVGLTTFLAQVILRRPLIEAATQEFFIDGTWIDPRVTKINAP